MGFTTTKGTATECRSGKRPRCSSSSATSTENTVRRRRCSFQNGEENTMRKLLFSVEDKVCDECALALRRYIGHREGIASVDVEN